MFIAVVNKTTRVTNEAALSMTRACAYQMRYHAAPGWGRSAASVVFYPSDPTSQALPASIPPGADLMLLLDTADQQGALGYHDETPDGRPYGKVFAATTLDNGGGILTGSLSVSSVLSHEIMELFVDPRCGDWWDAANGKLYAAEVGDPVEADSYPVPVKGIPPVMVSNFILPAWADPKTPHGVKVDHMGTAPGPFQMSKGGYVIVADVSNETQQFNQDHTAHRGSVDVLVDGEYPAWRTATKLNPAARTTKRISQIQDA